MSPFQVLVLNGFEREISCWKSHRATRRRMGVVNIRQGLRLQLLWFSGAAGIRDPNLLNRNTMRTCETLRRRFPIKKVQKSLCQVGMIDYPCNACDSHRRGRLLTWQKQSYKLTETARKGTIWKPRFPACFRKEVLGGIREDGGETWATGITFSKGVLSFLGFFCRGGDLKICPSVRTRTPFSI